jgi:serpin B
LTVEEVFKNVLLEYYDAEIRSANFADPATKDIINGWIEDKTHDKIKNMIDQIPPDVVMYLINAIYFKADWKYQFDESKTKPADFYLENGNTVQTAMMYCKGVKIDYFYNDNVFFMMIPYGNGQYTMTVMMPMHETPIQEIINETSVNNFRDFSLATDTATVELYMPKFKLEYKKLLNDVLADMGMGIAFGGGADLSNLFVDALDLFISRVIHQSFIEVNEKGSEAAAATVVEISETSVGPGGPPEVVYVDKPFAFFITEKHSNTILFAGKITDPTRLE